MGQMNQKRSSCPLGVPPLRVRRRRSSLWGPIELIARRARADTLKMHLIKTSDDGETDAERLGRSVILRGSAAGASGYPYFHRHGAELAKKPAFASQGPPLVKVGLHRTPHCHPTADGQTLLQHLCTRHLETGEHFCAAQTQGQERQPDDQAGTAFPEQVAKLAKV